MTRDEFRPRRAAPLPVAYWLTPLLLSGVAAVALVVHDVDVPAASPPRAVATAIAAPLDLPGSVRPASHAGGAASRLHWRWRMRARPSRTSSR